MVCELVYRCEYFNKQHSLPEPMDNKRPQKHLTFARLEKDLSHDQLCIRKINPWLYRGWQGEELKGSS